MLDTLLNYFRDQFGESEKQETPTPQIIDRYKDVFKTDKDEFDIIGQLWLQAGFCKFKNGLFWLVNPDEYTGIACEFPSVSSTSVAFARTGMGGIFLFDKKETGDSIIYLNTHLNTTRIISTSFQVFIPMDIPANTFWHRECYGKFELKVIEKYGALNHDECYTFVPALALGGDEKIGNIQKVKIKENLELLAQLHQ